MKLQDKVVVITGASSGIGEELAFQCAQKGSKVVVAARNKTALDQVAQKINSSGGQALAVQTDVSIRSQVENLVAQTLKEFGRLDIFVNNAGLTHPDTDLINVSEADLRKVMEVNFMGGVYGLWAAVPAMEKNGGGMLVYVSSVVGKRGVQRNAGYCASKFAIQGLTESIRLELKKKKIHVLTVCPPGVDTPFYENNNRGGVRRYRLHSTDKITRMLVSSIEKEKREVWMTMDSKILAWANNVVPALLDKAVLAVKGDKR